MALLELSGVSKSYGGIPAIDDLSLEIAQGEIVALLGPSGCGKTTVLRVVAGLEPDYAGKVLLDGQDLRGVRPNERDFGLMFQDLALFPHIDVFANVSFGLRMLGLPRAEQRERVTRLLDLVGLTGKEKRGIYELSGGERQRVALARSLAPEPRLLMLDEPLGALDRSLRESLTIEIRDVLQELGVSGLYVTHDQEEALTVAGRVAVMNAGRIEQIASPAEILRHPSSEVVARFMGYQNLLPARVVDEQVIAAGGLTIPAHGVADGDGLLLVPEDAITPDLPRLADPSAAHPPRGRRGSSRSGGEVGGAAGNPLAIPDNATSLQGSHIGKVLSSTPRGRRVDVLLQWHDRALHLDLPVSSASEIRQGEQVAFSIDLGLLHFMPEPPLDQSRGELPRSTRRGEGARG